MAGGASNELSMHCSRHRRWGLKTLNHLNRTKSIETLDGVESEPVWQKSLVFIMELAMTPRTMQVQKCDRGSKR